MNFQTLRAMIENLIKSFMCPMCNSNIKETSVEIIGAAGSTVNIDIECPTCKKHALIKAELAYNDAGAMNLTREKLEMVKDALKSMGDKVAVGSNVQESQKELQSINDSQIVELRQNLKNKNLSVSDLLGEGEAV